MMTYTTRCWLIPFPTRVYWSSSLPVTLGISIKYDNIYQWIVHFFQMFEFMSNLHEYFFHETNSDIANGFGSEYLSIYFYQTLLRVGLSRCRLVLVKLCSSNLMVCGLGVCSVNIHFYFFVIRTQKNSKPYIITLIIILIKSSNKMNKKTITLIIYSEPNHNILNRSVGGGGGVHEKCL